MTGKALSKILKDFPWLWAIADGWCPHAVDVTVEYATVSMTLEQLKAMWHNIGEDFHDFEIWIYETGYHGQKDGWVQRIYKLIPGPGGFENKSLKKTLQILLQQQIMMGGKIEYMTYRRGNCLKIFRPHKAYESFNDIFGKIITSSSD